MNYRTTAAIFAAATALASAVTAPAIHAETVVLEDTFTGVETALPGGERRAYPDPAKWGYTFWPGLRWPESYGSGTNWLEGNAESQTYLNAFIDKVKQQPVPAALRYDPFTISPEGLRIRAALLSPDQQAAYQVGGHRRFGSGMLLSRATFKYGKIRMTAKLPSARGSWPALWLLPKSNKWPPEIDVFEGMAWGPHARQIHVGVITPPREADKAMLKWIDLPASPSDGFHEYGLDWDKTTLRFLFDGVVIAEHPTPPSLQDEEMYVLINLAVGGKWVYNEVGVAPIDSIDEQRLRRGASTIEPDYPAELIVRSIKITQP